MKVLFFSGSYGHASKILAKDQVGEFWVDSLINELRKTQSISIAIACYYGNEKLVKKDADGIEYFFIPNVNGRVKRFLSRFKHNDQRKEDIYYFKEIISISNPSIIHVFGTEKGFGLVSEITEIPVIIHIQGIVNSILEIISNLRIKPGSLIRFDSLKNILTGKGLYHGMAYLRNKAKRELDIFRMNKHFIGRTEYDRRITNLLSPGSQYYHVDELLRTPFLISQWKKPSSGKIIIHSTISGAIYKGLDNIMLAAGLLKIYGLNFEWRIAGISSKDIIVNLWSRYLNKKIEEVPIILLGSLKTTELLEKMLEAHIYVHPSNIENSPNSVCEAMILGMPVIATDAGGTSGILKDKEEGILLQNGDQFHMAGAIIEMVNNYENAIGLAINAKVRALKRHDPEIVILNLIQVYKSVLEKSAEYGK